MNTGMRYGDVALGVESALPAAPRTRRGRVQDFVVRLMAALMRWA